MLNFEEMPGPLHCIPLEVVERHAGERVSSRGRPKKRKFIDKKKARTDWKIRERRERPKTIYGVGTGNLSGSTPDAMDRAHEASTLQPKQHGEAMRRRKELGPAMMLHAAARPFGIASPPDATQDPSTLDSESALEERWGSPGNITSSAGERTSAHQNAHSKAKPSEETPGGQASTSGDFGSGMEGELGRERNWSTKKKRSEKSLVQGRSWRENLRPLTAQRVLVFVLWQCLVSGVVCNNVSHEAGAQRELLGDEPVVSRIAFGSCRNQSAPQPIWKAISEYDPEVFVWLGDNIYSDSKLPVKFIGKQRTSGPWKNTPRFYQNSQGEVEKMYEVGKNIPGYVALRKTAQVIGTWDDHDYGLNDAGKELPEKDDRQKLMLDFLDEPIGSPRRKQKGVFTSYTYGPVGKRIKVILLDTRYHRDAPFTNGGMLGETQWAWLGEELVNGDAQVTLIGSSIQVVSNMSAMTQPFFHVESWANFPKEQERMYSLIAKSNASGVIFLSGDVHFCEITRYDCGPMGYPLFDITSSGLTQAVEEVGNSVLAFVLRFCAWWMPNSMRVYSKKCRNRSCVYGKRNFGTIDVYWDADPVTVKMQVRDLFGNAVSGVEVPLMMLQPGAFDSQPLVPGEIRRHCTLEANLPWTRKYLLAYSFFSSLIVLMVTPCATGYFTVKMLRARRRREPNQKPD